MGTIKAGTYRFNDVLNISSDLTETFVFCCNEVDYHTIMMVIAKFGDTQIGSALGFVNDNDEDSVQAYGSGSAFNDVGWANEVYQTITIPNDTEVSAEFLTWFTANAVADGVQISGKWKFKDVLTVPSFVSAVEAFNQPVQFETSGSISIGETGLCLGQGVQSWNNISFCFDADNNLQICYESDDFIGIPHYTAQDGFNAFSILFENEDFKGYGKTIDFGAEPQTVSAEFYNWLTANASQPMASITHNGEEIASLFPGQTATLKCAGMKMVTDVVVSVADNVGGDVCDKSHIIEVDELPETGEDGAIYSTPQFSAVAVCADGTIIEDIAKVNDMDAKHYTAVTLPETGEQNDICYVESENEVYVYMDGWYPANMLLPLFGFSVEMKGVITNTSEIAEDGYYVVMGSKALSLCTNGHYKTLITKGDLVFKSNTAGFCYVAEVEPYYDSKIAIPSVSPDDLTVNTISADSFYGCAMLTAVVIPDSVETIGRSAFENCYALHDVTMGSGVKTIANGAFARCYSLETVTIPDSVQTIGDNAFNSCYLLYEVTIGSGVKTIGTNAFRYCSDLYNIYFNGTTAQWATIDKELAWHEGTAAVEVTCTDGKVAL